MRKRKENPATCCKQDTVLKQIHSDELKRMKLEKYIMQMLIKRWYSNINVELMLENQVELQKNSPFCSKEDPLFYSYFHIFKINFFFSFF